MLQDLSIVTITYNNPEDLIKSYKSLETFRIAGGTQIIVNGGATIRPLIKDDCVLIEEPDGGIYDAINKGIERVNTPFFMLIHSGDFLVVPVEILRDQLSLMIDKHLDVLLNDCTIAFGNKKRLMSAKNWKPWMFLLGAQPPHPPVIYRIDSIRHFTYNIEYPVIADFDYLERIFKTKPNYHTGNQILVHMSAGGATSSGFLSFLRVNREFKNLKGKYIACFYSFTRPLIKIIQMFK